MAHHADAHFDPLDRCSQHSLLDRAYLTMELFNGYVLDHETLEVYPELKARAEQVSQALFDFYQAIGATVDW